MHWTGNGDSFKGSCFAKLENDKINAMVAVPKSAYKTFVFSTEMGKLFTTKMAGKKRIREVTNQQKIDKETGIHLFPYSEGTESVMFQKSGAISSTGAQQWKVYYYRDNILNLTSQQILLLCKGLMDKKKPLLLDESERVSFFELPNSFRTYLLKNVGELIFIGSKSSHPKKGKEKKKGFFPKI
jgi:hypothetical protein